MTHQHVSIPRIALSLTLAASLTATPFAAALAEGDASASNAASTPAAAQTDEPAAEQTDEPATDEETVKIDEKTWKESEERNAEIVKAANKAQLVGSSVLEDYLAGKKVAVSAFLKIDVKRLASIDEDLAKLIKAEQEKITGTDSESEASTSNAAATVGTTDKPSSTASDGAKATASADANEAAEEETEVEDAPDDAVATKENTDQEEDEIVYVARNLTTEQFIETIGEDARELCQDNDLYASVMIAQAIVESASGSSGLSCDPYNNLFGIKGSYQGKSVRMKTQEDDGEGNLETIVAEFRRYPTLKDSLSDYVSLLTGNSLYSPVKKSNASSYEVACDYLQGHYATSTSYAKTLKAYIEAYDLTQYDEAAATENHVVRGDTLEEVLVPVATQTTYQIETSDMGLDDGVVAIEETPRTISPLVAGVLASGAAALLGTGAFYLYWRRKVEHECAAHGKHAAVAFESADTGEIDMSAIASKAGAHAGTDRTRDEGERA